jgi:hypothetical protein
VLHTAGSSITGAIKVARSLGGTSRVEVLAAAHQAFLHGLRLALVTAAVLAASGAVFAAWRIPSHRTLTSLDEDPLLGEDFVPD